MAPDPDLRPDPPRPVPTGQSPGNGAAPSPTLPVADASTAPAVEHGPESAPPASEAPPDAPQPASPSEPVEPATDPEPPASADPPALPPSTPHPDPVAASPLPAVPPARPEHNGGAWAQPGTPAANPSDEAGDGHRGVTLVRDRRSVVTQPATVHLAPSPSVVSELAYLRPAAGDGPAADALARASATPRRRADRRLGAHAAGPDRSARSWPRRVLVGLQVTLFVALLAAVVALAVRADHLGDDLGALRAQRGDDVGRLSTAEQEADVTRDDVSDILGILEENAAADPAAIAGQVQPSVFTVLAAEFQGSAWVVANDASTSQLVTNFHVVAKTAGLGESSVTLVGGDGAMFSGTIDRAVPSVDLALITVNRVLPVLDTSTDIPRAGAPLVVVGSPLGLAGSVTTGAVSAPRRTLADGISYIQFAAPISPGNSGGPVVDSRGKVVGVATAKIVEQNAEGIGFALPVSEVCDRFEVCED